MPADFNFYLNRQGVRGKKGDKGDKGFSPNISIGDNTQESFTLVVQNEFDTFETPNLKEGLVPEDRNGTYVRLDRETGQQYYGEPDIATESTSGVIKLATQDEVNAGEEETKAVTPDTLAIRLTPIETNVSNLDTRTSTLETKMTTAESNITTLQAQMSTAESDIDTLQSQVATNTSSITSVTESVSTIESDITEINADIATIEGNISTLQESVSTLEASVSTLETQIPDIATTTTAGTVKPDGTTITITNDGTITAVGGGGGGTGDVTAAGNNVFTGSNTFQQAITLQASSSGQLLNFVDQYGSVIGMTTAGNSSGLRFNTLSTTEPFLLSTLSDNQEVFFLNQASVHNGNGITVTTTNTTDITIAAEVNQQDVDELGNELNALSSTVTSLESAVSTLETTMPSIATTAKAGTVKPDGTTITITDDGTITAVGGGGGSTPENMVTTNTDQNITGIKDFRNGLTISSNGTYPKKIINASNVNESAIKFEGADIYCGNTGSSNTGIRIYTTDHSYARINVSEGIVRIQPTYVSQAGIQVTNDGAGYSDSTGVYSAFLTEANLPTTIATTDTDNVFTGSNKFDELVNFQSQNNAETSAIARLGAKNIGGSTNPIVLHSVDDIFVGTVNNDPSGVTQRGGTVYLASESIYYASIKATSRTTTEIQPYNGSQAKLRVTTTGAGFVDSSGTYQQFATSADLTNLGAFKYVVITADDYAGLATKDPDTLYRVTTDGVTTAVYMGEFQLGSGSTPSGQVMSYSSEVSTSNLYNDTNNTYNNNQFGSTNVTVEKVEDNKNGSDQA